MPNKHTIPALILTLSLTLLPACTTTETPTTPAPYQQISQEQAQTMMADTAIILDVRREDEYAEKHIPNAICIPNEDIETKDNLDQLLPDKNQTILVYCRSGRRSKEAAQKLADMGYTNVYEFGGINDWTGDTVTE